LLADRENRSINILGNFRPRPPREDKSKHLTHRYLDVLKPLAIPGVQSVFRFAPDAAHVDHVRREVLKDEAVEYIGLFPGAGHPSRCWPLASFLALAERISVSGGSPVFFLGPEESTLKASIEERLPPRSLIVHDLTIPQFIAATQRLAAFVTNDTGPMHLAACAGAPVLLLLDERAPMTYLPLTERLTIVRDATIDRISVDRVYGALRGELLSK
jgi:heptosyltransferase II